MPMRRRRPAPRPPQRPAPADAAAAADGRGRPPVRYLHGFPQRRSSASGDADRSPRWRRSPRSWSAAARCKGRRLPIKVPVVNIGRADFNDVVHRRPERQHQPRQAAAAGRRLGPERPGLAPTAPSSRASGSSGEVALGPGTTIRFGEVAVLFEPLDDDAIQPARRRDPGAGSRWMPSRARPPEADEARPRRARPQRRPIRASAPKPSGPPAWLVAAAGPDRRGLAYLLLR